MTRPGDGHWLRGRINAVRAALDRVPIALTRLAARVAVATVFFQAGMIKTADWAVTLELFAGDYHVPLMPPALAAIIATGIELTCSIMIAFGIGARIGAAGLLGLILVVQLFVYPENWPDHLVWGTLLVQVLARGPGPISIDHLIARRWLDRI